VEVGADEVHGFLLVWKPRDQQKHNLYVYHELKEPCTSPPDLRFIVSSLVIEAQGEPA
jgi:hypothetical protein